VFLSLSSPEEAIARVAERVRHGGHHVPSDVIRRRFTSGMRNFLEVYRYRVDLWQWFDNSRRSVILIEE
jgi:predicted ABC-type ATPase